MGTCVECGTELACHPRGRPQVKFCSRQCKERSRSMERAALVAAKRATRMCVQCGAHVPGGRSGKAITCSRECSVVYQNAIRATARRREWDTSRPTCGRCGIRIPDDRRPGAKFCSFRCKHNAMSEKRRETAPHYMRQYLYGITPEDFVERLSAQGGACAVCRSKAPGGKGNFHVDHDHETGRVRGLLCHGCNVGLGNFRDEPELLEQAAAYLRR